jgi:hypothetical protein
MGSSVFSVAELIDFIQSSKSGESRIPRMKAPSAARIRLEPDPRTSSPVDPRTNIRTALGSTVRGESQGEQRDARAARWARREERAYREYSTDEQRRPPGCLAGRMPTNS